MPFTGLDAGSSPKVPLKKEFSLGKPTGVDSVATQERARQKTDIGRAVELLNRLKQATAG